VNHLPLHCLSLEQARLSSGLDLASHDSTPGPEQWTFRVWTPVPHSSEHCNPTLNFITFPNFTFNHLKLEVNLNFSTCCLSQQTLVSPSHPLICSEESLVSVVLCFHKSWCYHHVSVGCMQALKVCVCVVSVIASGNHNINSLVSKTIFSSARMAHMPQKSRLGQTTLKVTKAMWKYFSVQLSIAPKYLKELSFVWRLPGLTQVCFWYD
jgi:hypothetical protein